MPNLLPNFATKVWGYLVKSTGEMIIECIVQKTCPPTLVISSPKHSGIGELTLCVC